MIIDNDFISDLIIMVNYFIIFADIIDGRDFVVVFVGSHSKYIPLRVGITTTIHSGISDPGEC